jgi:prepilin-type N-terminal cleavage/methylation domain-containing protein
MTWKIEPVLPLRPHADPSLGRRPAGFTLIEVLIATVILSIGLTALLTAASRCLAVMRVAKQYQDAQWVLSLGELEHPILPTEEYSDWEVSGETHGEVTYTREVFEPDDDHKDGLFILTSRASWSSRGRESYEEVMRLVFVPEEAEFLQ